MFRTAGDAVQRWMVMEMYESPIKIIYGQMQTQLEGDILKAVMSTDIQVDREELIHALRYDRDQYERGFADGYMNAQQEIVRCKDCKHRGVAWINGKHMCHNPYYGMASGVELRDDDFCSYGERKDNG